MNKVFNIFKKSFLFILLPVILLFLLFWLRPFFSLSIIQSHLDYLLHVQDQQPLFFLFLFFFAFVLSTCLAMPSGIFFLLGSGFFFPIYLGIIICALSFTLSAYIIYLVTNYFNSSFVKKKFSVQLSSFKKKLEHQQDAFLLFLRCFPLFPFFWSSVLIVFCNVPLKKYLLFTFFGLIPYSSIYIFLGNKLSSIKKLEDLISSEVFILLGLIFLSTILAIIFRKKIIKS